MIIGQRLKKIRKERNLTLNEVARETNLSASLLSQIENDKVSPSLNTLQTVLSYYGVGFSTFFQQKTEDSYLIVKRENVEVYRDLEAGITLELLASKLHDTTLINYIVTMKQAATLRFSTLNESLNGERFLFVLSGAVEIMIGNEKSGLEHGDSANFKAHCACTLINRSADEVRMVISGYPPIF